MFKLRYKDGTNDIVDASRIPIDLDSNDQLSNSISTEDTINQPDANTTNAIPSYGGLPGI